jgi:RNA polymerase sigma-70 factor (ECF subfamily)
MALLAEKHRTTLEEAVSHLISRAENSRSLDIADLTPRISKTLEKYLLTDSPNASGGEIKEFIGALNAGDLCLIVACEHGDESAWADLLAKYDTTVKQAARSVTGNTEDAEDLASSIWAELHGLKQSEDGRTKGKLSYYSGRGSLAGWLRAVVSQLAVDQYRKISRFVQIEEPREFENLAQDSSEKTEATSILHTAENPEEVFTDAESRKDVSDALKLAFTQLAAEDRLMLKLYYFDNLKLKDIGSTLGFHEATASRKLVRIQGDLKKAVEKILAENHGWRKEEIVSYLAEAASRLDVSVEKMLGVFAIALILQDFIG